MPPDNMILMADPKEGVLELAGTGIFCTIVYSSRRKSWTIEVRQATSVIVRVPDTMTSGQVHALVQEKTAWILQQAGKFEARQTVSRNYEDGEVLPFLGTGYPVERRHGNTVKAEFTGDAFVITLPDGFSPEDQRLIARDAVTLLYRRIGYPPLAALIEKYAPAAGVAPPKLRLRVQEKKWGCCTPKNGIIINARVLLAPEPVAEYIVVHELAHIRFRHHQKSFWNEVERLMPGYRGAERILKEDGWKFVF
jgi:predicted metal-dependent hydrolase